MATTTMLDNISTAIEQVVKTLRGTAPTKKRMTLDDFVSYALAQIQKATKDEPEVAKRRLVALKRSVDEVIAGVAKLSVEDIESEASTSRWSPRSRPPRPTATRRWTT